MNKKQQQIDTIANKYDDIIDYKVINTMLANVKENINYDISKQTIKNIAKWSLNGLDYNEIADRLELSKKQFDILCSVCPLLVCVMQESRELANIYITGSAFQRALGGQKITKQKAIVIDDYNEDGKKIGQHIEIVELQEELPPDANLLRFFMENKMSENFGKGKDKIDLNENRKIIQNLTEEELKACNKHIKLEDLEDIDKED